MNNDSKLKASRTYIRNDMVSRSLDIKDGGILGDNNSLYLDEDDKFHEIRNKFKK